MSSTPITHLSGRAMPLPGRDIDTDRIMPARFLRAVTFEGLDAHVFADDRAALARENRVHPIDDPIYRDARILIVESNFGCGSSREHAPQAIARRGIAAIVGESFAEIFRGNAGMIGLPCVTAAPADVARLLALVAARPETDVVVDLDAMTVSAGDLIAAIDLPAELRSALRSGNWDATALLLDRYDEVERVAARLPAIGERP
jgi:3-isopropylmalate/(R)-2-methylmalate dehydratase small subunit